MQSSSFHLHFSLYIWVQSPCCTGVLHHCASLRALYGISRLSEMPRARPRNPLESTSEPASNPRAYRGQLLGKGTRAVCNGGSEGLGQKEAHREDGGSPSLFHLR